MQLGIVGIIRQLRRLLETQHRTVIQLAALCLVVAPAANNEEHARRRHMDYIMRRACHVQCADFEETLSHVHELTCLPCFHCREY